MSKTIKNFKGNGSQKEFNFGMDYLQKDFIHLSVNEVEKEYGRDYVVADQDIIIIVAPPKDSDVVIRRVTSTKPLVTWSDATVLTATDMTMSEVQLLHLSEEVTDSLTLEINVSTVESEKFAKLSEQYSNDSKQYSLASAKSAEDSKGFAESSKSQVVLASQQVDASKEQVGLAKEQVTLATAQAVIAKEQADIAKEQADIAIKSNAEANGGDVDGGTVVIGDKIQQRRDTILNWSTKNPILNLGEVGVAIDPWRNREKKGDGVTTWNKLPYTRYQSSVAFLGDSIIAGSPYFKSNVPPTDQEDIYSLVAYVRSALGIDVKNKGIGGQTTTEIKARINTDIVNNGFTHCFIEGGINDLFQESKLVPFNTTTSNFVSMVYTCQSNGIVPILVLPTPTRGCIYTNPTKDAGVDKIREWLITYASQNNILVIDFYNALLQNVSKGVIMSLLTEDGLHPNKDGYRRLGMITTQYLQKLLPELKGTSSVTEGMLNFYATGQSPSRAYNIGEIVASGSPTEEGFASYVCSTGGASPTFLTSGNLRKIEATPTNAVAIYDSTDGTNKYWQAGDIIISNFPTEKKVEVRLVTTKGWTGNDHVGTPDRAVMTLQCTLPYKDGGGGGGGEPISPWVTASLTNSWSTYVPAYGSNYSVARYYKDNSSLVRLGGVIKGGVVGGGALANPSAYAMFTLPVGFRPSYQEMFAVVSGNSIGCVVVDPSGAVCPTAGVNTSMCLDGIAFRAER